MTARSQTNRPTTGTQSGVHGRRTVTDESAVSSPRVLLPVFRAVAQLIFELLLRPMVVEHAVHPASTGRIRLAPSTLWYADRTIACACSRVIGPLDPYDPEPRWRPLSFEPLRPARRAPRVLRTSVLIAPALISLPGLVPAMVVMDIALGRLPNDRCSTGRPDSTAPPNTHQDRGVRPVAVVPPILTVQRGVPIAFDPLVIGSGLRRDAVRARRRRRRRRCGRRTKSAHALRAQTRAATPRLTRPEVFVSC